MTQFDEIEGADVEAGQGLGTRSLATRGGRVTWENVSLSVDVKKGFFKRKNVGIKKILDDVSGTVAPGELLFIMGPSGAGKTSLLDVLADRVAAKVEGTKTLDGHPIDQKLLRPRAKYVEQSEHMYQAMTTRETLRFAGNFYCEDPAQREVRVEETLDVLGLREQADVRVGGLFIRGLSGGQRRRLAVGSELVARPEVLFLDEPTSGLDSAACHGLVTYLRKIAREVGISIICTIHQPSSELFQMSDRLHLLSSGRTAYFGPTSEVESYFQKLGYPCPKLMSIAEHVIDLINGDFGDKILVEKILNSWSSSAEKETLQREIEECRGLEVSTDTDQKAGCLGGAPGVSFFTQFNTVLHRTALNTIRNPAVIWLRAAMYLGLAVMIGTAWLRLDRTVCNITDFTGALFFIAAFMVFMSVSVLPAYIEERAIVMHERANGAYGVFVFNLAHTLLGLVMVFFLALFAGTICYWLIGFNPQFGQYAFFIFNLFLSFAVAESMMVLVASMIPILILGIALGAFVYGGFMIVQGYFIRLENIGWWWRWMHYIGLHSYSFSSFMLNEFTDTVWSACSNPIFGDQPVSGDVVLEYYDYAGNNMWVNTGVLVGMVVIYRLLAMGWQYKFHTAKK